MKKINKYRRKHNLPELMSIYDYVEYKQYEYEKKIEEKRRYGDEISGYEKQSAPRIGYAEYLSTKRRFEKQIAEQQEMLSQETTEGSQTEAEKSLEESYFDSGL